LQEISYDLLEESFIAYYTGLHRYAYTIVRNNETARDAVQQVFTRLWERREQIHLTVSLQSYLYTAIHNHCINLKTRSVVWVPIEAALHQTVSDHHAPVETKELEVQIQQALQKLPEQARMVFVLSRYEQKSYAEIAGLLNISQKTVEGHISRALRTMREELQTYLPVAGGSAFILLYLMN